MADTSQPSNQVPSAALTALQNIVTAINGILQQISKTATLVKGTLTLAATGSTTIANSAITSGMVITLSPTNASAATLMGSAKSLYISSITPGSGFVVTTASGGAPAGTETFSYKAE